MIKSQSIFPGLVLLLFFLAMAATVAQPDGIKISQPYVFSNSFDKTLYKSAITVHGKELSGLVFIKRTGETFRVVFLSEIGIKYFDIEIGSDPENDFIVHSMMEMLNRKPLTDFIENTFRMLSMSFGEIKKEDSFICDGSGNRVVVLKTKHYGKFRYDYHPNFGHVNLMWHYGFLKKKLVIELSEYDYLAPSLIVASQQKMEFRLLRIEN